MANEKRSPEISKLEWGIVEVKPNQQYKDVKLYPGGSREWDWNETGTSHIPGIQPGDIEELLEHSVEIVILSRGYNERLQVKQDTIDMLVQNDIEFHILQTEQAVLKYNKLRKHHRVGALIHSTC